LPTYLGTSLGLHSILFSPVRRIRVGARAREGRGAQFIAFAPGTENPGYATVKLRGPAVAASSVHGAWSSDDCTAAFEETCATTQKT